MLADGNALGVFHVHGEFAEVGLLFAVEVEILKLEVLEDHALVKRFDANDGEERVSLCRDADIAVGDIVNISELDVGGAKGLIGVGDQIGEQRFTLGVVFLRL